MTMKRNRLWLVLLALCLHSGMAHAYLDPSTGSMVISAIVGLFASLVLAIKTYWYRIKSFFNRDKPSSPTPPEEPRG